MEWVLLIIISSPYASHTSAIHSQEFSNVYACNKAKKVVIQRPRVWAECVRKGVVDE